MKPMFLRSSRRGSVLVFSLLILSIMLVTSLTILSTALLDRKASLSTGSSARSFQVADSGVEETLYRIYKESHPTLSALAGSIGASCSGSSINFPSAGGEVKVTFYEGETTPYAGGCSGTDWRDRVVKIKSEGTAGSTARAVEVAVACASFLDAELVRDGATGDPANAQGLAVDGNYAYVAGTDDASEKGLHVFDISNPSDLQHVGFLPTESGPAMISGWGDDALGVTISGNHAYIATYYGGMVIADISTPTSPSYVGKINLPGETWSVEPEGNYAYTATDRGIRVIDISNKSNPSVVGSYDFSAVGFSPTRATDIVLYDPDGDGDSNYAYLSLQTGGVGTVDITNPSSPQMEDRITSDFASDLYAYDVAVYDGPGTDYLYVVRHAASVSSAAQGAVLTYSLADPANPTLVDTDLVTPSQVSSPRTVSVSGDDLYVGGGASGIHLYTLADASDPAFRERIIQSTGNFWDVVPSNGKIFSAGGSTGLYSFEVCGQ